MAKKGRRSAKHTPHRSATRRPTATRSHTPPQDPETQELIAGLRATLRSDNFTEFLVVAASIATEARAIDAQPMPAGWVSFTQSLLEVDLAETTALLHVVAATTPDDIERQRIQRTLDRRRQPIPHTITGLAGATVDAAWFMGDELGDGDNIILGLTWPTGERATALAYIDHNMGRIVKDAFFIPEPLDSVVARYNTLIEESGHRVGGPVPTDLADARARIEQGLANLDELNPDWEQDGWPMSRPLLEFFVRTLPAGGTGYAVHKADDVDLSALVAQFLGSPEARAFAADDAVVEAVGALLWFAARHSGDPLRWSGVSVEVALVSELPFDPAINEHALDVIPDVLPALIRFAHRERRISAEGTSEALAAVPRWLPDYQRMRDLGVTSDLREAQAQLDAFLAGDHGPMMRDKLISDLGTPLAVENLDDRALPDEPLDTSGLDGGGLDGGGLANVDTPTRELVTVISAEIDRVVSQGPFPVFDIEFRTACRRFLTTVAVREPEMLSRRGAKAVNTAATIVWIIGRANDLVGYPPRPVQAKAIWPVMGVTAANSTRAAALIGAFDPTRGRDGDFGLGDPRLLVSDYRRTLLTIRDQWWLEGSG